MASSQDKLSFRELVAIFLQEVIKADTSFQIHQIDLWRAAAATEPTLTDYLDASGRRLSDSPQDLPLLLEGLDRQSNLALKDVTLEFKVQLVKPNVFKRLFYKLMSKPTPRLKLATGDDPDSPSITLKLTASRDSLGEWRNHIEKIDLPADLADADVSEIEKTFRS